MLGEDGLAGLQVERDRARARLRDVRDRERPREALGERRVARAGRRGEHERQHEGDDRQTAAGHPRHCWECRYRRQVWASGARGDRPRGPCSRAGNRLIIGRMCTRDDSRTARADRRAARRAGRRAGQPRAPRADAHRRLRLRAGARVRALAARAADVRADGRARRGRTSELKAKELALLSDRLAANADTALGPARRAHAPARANERRSHSLARRARCGPRRPRPGCGSRSAASSGCSRCGS